MSKDVFIIGIDGGTWDLIDQLVAKGELPTIAKLVKNGSRGALESTLLPITPVAWTTFATGKNPDKHGIFDFSHRKNGTYEPAPYSSNDRKGETLWKILSRAGKKVGVLNMPSTYPVEKVNGFLVSGFPTPEEMGDFTYPSNLLKELKDQFGDEFRFQPRVNAQNEHPFLEEMKIVSDYVFKATKYLMNKYPWDFLNTVFVGPDALGHVFYKYMDPDHPSYIHNGPKKFQTAVVESYKKIDEYISKLLKSVDSTTTIMLMSDHGFGPLYYGVSINNWLIDNGFLNLKNERGTRFRYWMFQKGVNYNNLFKLIKNLNLSKQAFKAAYSKKSKWVDLVNKLFLTDKDIDWTRTSAYCMGNMGQLFINLKGREPQGIIEHDADYKKIVDKFIVRLKKLKSPDTGKVIFDEVYRKRDAYPNSSIEDNTPDVIFNDSQFIYSVSRYFEFGSKELITPHPVWSGTHRRNGIFLAHCPNKIRKGDWIENVSISDIAPNVLHIMGVPIPNDIDGRVVPEMYDKLSEYANREPEFQHVEEDRILDRIAILKKKGKLLL
jgi:predicted AlkP superfamily phosphohydrolase/phosphomutase